MQLEESVRSSNEPPAKRMRSSQTTTTATTTPEKPTPERRLPQEITNTPSTNVANATSPGSRADYTCYTIRGADGVLTVVTKMEQSSQDALAQVYSNHLLTAAHFSLKLWEAPALVEKNCLRLLACLFHAALKDYSIEYDAAEPHEEMRKIVPISTVIDTKDEEIAAHEAEKARLEAKNARMEAKNARMEAKVKELERQLEAAKK